MSLTAAARAALTGVAVHDAGAPDKAALPYVVIYSDEGLYSTDRLSGGSRDVTVILTTHSCGATADAARIVRGKVLLAWLDKRLTVTGWACQPIAHEVARPLVRDTDADPPAYDLVDQWRLVATRTD